MNVAEQNLFPGLGSTSHEISCSAQYEGNKEHENHFHHIRQVSFDRNPRGNLNFK